MLYSESSKLYTLLNILDVILHRIIYGYSYIHHLPAHVEFYDNKKKSIQSSIKHLGGGEMVQPEPRKTNAQQRELI